jgi:hypothetical protein
LTRLPFYREGEVNFEGSRDLEFMHWCLKCEALIQMSFPNVACECNELFLNNSHSNQDASVNFYAIIILVGDLADKMDSIPRSSYYDKHYKQSAALIRARRPYLIKNITTGIGLFGFCIGVCAYNYQTPLIANTKFLW